MRWLLRVVLILTVLLSRTPAHARSLTIQRFDSSIVVDREGGLLVTETLTVQFEGKWNGLERFIPLATHGSEGELRQLELRVLEVRDGTGAALGFDSKQTDDVISIRVHVPTTDAARTIAIRYLVLNGVRLGPATDEIVWNVTGDRWSVPIAQASARVSLPLGVQDVRSGARVTRYGDELATISPTQVQGGISAEVNRPLLPRDGLIVRVTWKSGLIEPVPPSLAKRLDRVFPTPVRYALLVAVVTLALWLCADRIHRWLLKRRLEPHHSPPSELAPAELAALLDERAGERYWLATLVDLAVRGRLVIYEHATPAGTRFEVRPTGGSEPLAPRLRPHEARVLSIGSYPLDAERPADSEDSLACARFHSALRRYLSDTYGIQLPRLARRCLVHLEQALFVVMVLVLMMLIVGISERLGLAVLLGSLLVTWVSLHGCARSLGRLKPTARGIQTQARRFAAFLSSTPQEIRTHHRQSTLERLLPYAIATGNEANWLAAASGAMPPMSWYRRAESGEPLPAALLPHRLEALCTVLPVMTLAFSFFDGSYWEDLGSNWDAIDDEPSFRSSYSSSSSSYSSSSSSDGGGGGGGF